MIIREALSVRTGDRSNYAWSNLRKYQNVDYVHDRIIKLHNLPLKHHDIARKQAQQIRYCVIQAREYFSAAEAVSIATKPNLLYYGIMSLALCEILFKQDGRSSLDKAREQNRHHGLTMTAAATREKELAAAARKLKSVPLEIAGERRGTFAIWHKTAREHPFCGQKTDQHETGGITDSYGVVFSATDKPLPAIPKVGLTLAECLCRRRTADAWHAQSRRRRRRDRRPRQWTRRVHARAWSECRCQS